MRRAAAALIALGLWFLSSPLEAVAQQSAKAPKVLGLTIPQTFLLRADAVLQ